MADLRTPYDDLPIDVRRANWGWFGAPWPSVICYEEDGRLIEEMRKPFPVGEACLYCNEVFDEAAGDSGKAIPFMGTAAPRVIHVHKECALREVVGSLAHLQGHCACQKGSADPSLQTSRQDALAVWEWVQQHGI